MVNSNYVTTAWGGSRIDESGRHCDFFTAPSREAAEVWVVYLAARYPDQIFVAGEWRSATL